MLNPRHPSELDPSIEVSFVPMPAVNENGWKLKPAQKRALGEVRKGYTHFANGDVLFAKITPCMENGKAAVAEDLANGLGCGTTELHVIRPVQGFQSKFLYYFVHREDFRKAARQNMTGTAGQLRVPLSFLKESEIPVPPTAEQIRIVAKLEKLLAKVDACKDRLEKIPAILKRFRQSVLAAATSGKLTEEWRKTCTPNLKPWVEVANDKAIPLPDGYERLNKQTFKLVHIEHGADDLPSTWALLTVGELYELRAIIDFADGNHGSLYPRKEEFGPDGALFLTATQIGENWELDVRNCPRLRHEKAAQLTKGWSRAGDVLLTHNATVGRVALLEYQDEKVLLGTSVTFYRFNDAFVRPRFARVLFSSDFFQQQLRSVMEQTTRNQVPISKQVSFHFICPPVEEQHEIVRRVEALFKIADDIEQRYQKAKAHVDKLTQSILAKAFRGELVPQDPDDEPASELLKRIQVERKNQEAEARPGRKSTRRKVISHQADGRTSL